MHGIFAVLSSSSSGYTNYGYTYYGYGYYGYTYYVTVLREEQQLIRSHRREAVPARAGSVGSVLREACRQRLRLRRLLLLLRYASAATCAAACATLASVASAAPASAASASAVARGVQR